MGWIVISIDLFVLQTDHSRHNLEDSLDIGAADTVDSTQREICFLLFTKFSKEVRLMFYGNIGYGVTLYKVRCNLLYRCPVCSKSLL